MVVVCSTNTWGNQREIWIDIEHPNLDTEKPLKTLHILIQYQHSHHCMLGDQDERQVLKNDFSNMR